MSIKLGRNDPCHCGSGKKYKKCHLAIDEQNRPVVHETAADSPVPAPSPDLAQMAPAEQISTLLDKLEQHGSKKDRVKWAQLKAQHQQLLSYMERREEIETAGKVLEDHRAEFEKILADENAYLARTQELFAEERFAPMRFSPAEVKQALRNLGFVHTPMPTEEDIEKIGTAIKNLATKERRTQLSMQLSLQIPDLVAGGRYLDAWLVQHCAYLTGEITNETNPFLFQMFSFGYDAWQAEERRGDESVIREMGLDPERLQSMSVEEIDAWLKEQQADPVKKAKMEALMQAHPDKHSQAVASLERMERDSTKLLDRDDADAFLLKPEELEPWIPTIEEFWESTLSRFPNLAGNAKPDENTAKALAKAVWELAGKIAQNIFTPERIQQLIVQLQHFRNKQFAAGHRDMASAAMGAITSVENEKEPGNNYFLNYLCFLSLRRFSGSVVKSKQESEEAGTSSSSAPEK